IGGATAGGLCIAQAGICEGSDSGSGTRGGQPVATQLRPKRRERPSWDSSRVSRNSRVGSMSRTRQSATLAALSMALLACSAAQPRPSSPPGPPAVVAQLGGPSVAAPPFGASPGLSLPRASRGTDLAPTLGAAAAGPPSNGRSATINTTLLREISPPMGDADLPLGPGDLIEISVFEVEELSKIKVRIPMRGTITLPLLGQV